MTEVDLGAGSAALPPELRPWAKPLAIFPAEVALSLGPLVRKVARMIGAWESQGSRLRGEPDGYDGLARKGPLERLLPSEWLLALELPDEFIRRAASSEQAFFALASRTPAGSRRSFALFDAGPSSLGGPRIG